MDLWKVSVQKDIEEMKGNIRRCRIKHTLERPNNPEHPR